MRIQSLLNPLSLNDRDYRESTSSVSPRTIPRSLPQPAPLPKRQKLAKDAAIFAKGKTKGEVRYPPYEAGDDEELASQHRKYQIYPMGHIADYCRHIPYNSEKKSFLAKTGRESFEVFQYTFKVPGEEREYTVMWDYNVGLVRITPFFKCCKYSKTTPARVLNLNPGLRDISHSITGGALAAQGYWMPFAAAEAVAATFCHSIRWALTPLFGRSFVNLCTHPSDPLFASFRIPASTIRACTAETQQWRAATPDQSIASASLASTPALPGCSNGGSRYAPFAPKALRPRVGAASADVESGYGTDTDQSDRYLFSPAVSPKTRAGGAGGNWTAVNGAGPKPPCAPRSCADAQDEHGPPRRPDRGRSHDRDRDDRRAGDGLRVQQRAKRRLSALDDDDDDDDDDGGDGSSAASEAPSGDEAAVLAAKKVCLTSRSREARAAYLMMQLSVADAELAGGVGERRRRSRRASN